MRYESNIPQVVGTGFTVLDRIFEDGFFTEEALGGSCGNVLVSLAMLRRHVVPVIAIGADDVGQQLVDEFAEAGADIRFIYQRSWLSSPVIAQELDTLSGHHRFRFDCRDTLREFPRYHPIQQQEVTEAACVLAACSVFYTDRLSESIVDAMRQARAAGALIYFEPSDVDGDLFEDALRLSSIVKYSSDRLGADVNDLVADTSAIAIVTHGADGLEVRQGTISIWCEAIPVERVADTCGSGDMVSVGLIDWLLGDGRPFHSLALNEIVAGVVAGQHLAAANCAYTGARGLFRDKGAVFARHVLHSGVSFHPG